VEQYLEFVIKGLVDFPDEIVIVKHESGQRVLFNVQVNPQDVGKIIGKHGQTIEAIRAVLSAGAARQGLKAAVELI
jgi:uncharacterized protein